jgi:class 3 adenylate cyclase
VNGGAKRVELSAVIIRCCDNYGWARGRKYTPAMPACPSCGVELPENAKFCLECGAKVEARSAAAPERRKVVTILFSDVAGSTAMGERLDPEAVRGLMSRYFAAMRAVIERHGGTVEKFIGDAIMAVFGIPQLHEDDALRAVRAAVEMRTALEALNRELGAQQGVTIETRTGITTGEVVVGDPAADQTLVTGDPVNTAARLEQAAPGGEILIGEATWRLVRDAVAAEPVEPVAAKGKAEAVPAHRLISVRANAAEGHQRRMDAPLVGREDELAQLRHAYGAAVEQRTPRMVTVLGAAGVGKSRLVNEFLTSVADEARVLRGRCLPYGEGITYWPLREIVHAIAGITDGDGPEEGSARLRSLLGDDPEADGRTRLVGAAIGLSNEPAPQEEIFWAVRRLLEDMSRRQPMVLVFDDIHWAEETMLDLLEYILDLSADAPILLLCPARPELLDARPGWGGSRQTTAVLHLDGLGGDACERLIAALPGGVAVPAGLRARILSAAEGNPLYVEEMLGMLVDEGHLAEANGGWRAADRLEDLEVPLSVRALLSARIDALPTAERQVAERASVVGRIFEAAAVRELSAGVGRDVGGSLLALVRKELVRPERSELTAGDAFKFRHLLIRDAAYEALPKRERADLHERFASWLERVAGERLTEYEAIIGYHLHQAFLYLRELGDGSDRVDAIGSRAGERLHAAGDRAGRQGDIPAARELLSKAVAAGTGHPRNGWWQLRLADAIGASDPNEAIRVLEGVISRASADGDDHLRARGVIDRLGLERMTASEGWPARAERELTPLDEPLSAADDMVGLANLNGLRATVSGDINRVDDALTAVRRAIGFAERGDDRQVEENLRIYELNVVVAMGPSSAADLESMTERVLDRTATRGGRAQVRATLAYIHAMAGSMADARNETQAAIDELREMGILTQIPFFEADQLLYATWEGDLALGEELGPRLIDDFAEMGDTESVDMYYAGSLAEILNRRGGRSQEVLARCEEILEAHRYSDVRTEIWGRTAQIEALLALGRMDAASEVFGTIDLELSAMASHTARAWLLLRLADVARALGDVPLARRLVDQAHGIAERKGFAAGLQRAQTLLADLDRGAAASQPRP